MPSPTTSLPSALVKAMIPAFATEYGMSCGVPSLPAIDDNADDAAALLRAHVRNHRATDEEHAVEVDADDLVPVLVLQFPQRRDAAHHAGVVDEDVDALKAGEGIADQCCRPAGVAHVGGDAVRRIAALAQIIGGPLDARAVDVGENRARARLTEALRDGEADPAGAAGDQRHALVQPKLVHGVFGNTAESAAAPLNPEMLVSGFLAGIVDRQRITAYTNMSEASHAIDAARQMRGIGRGAPS